MRLLSDRQSQVLDYLNKLALGDSSVVVDALARFGLQTEFDAYRTTIYVVNHAPWTERYNGKSKEAKARALKVVRQQFESYLHKAKQPA